MARKIPEQLMARKEAIGIAIRAFTTIAHVLRTKAPPGGVRNLTNPR
jgi:hypothetical protein